MVKVKGQPLLFPYEREAVCVFSNSCAPANVMHVCSISSLKSRFLLFWGDFIFFVCFRFLVLDLQSS